MNILVWKEMFGFVFFHDICNDPGDSKTTKTRTDKDLTLLSSPEARENGARHVTVYVGTSRSLF